MMKTGSNINGESGSIASVYRAPLHSCGRCGLSASYFADQKVDQDHLSSTNGDATSKELGELISDDRAIEEMLARAERGASSSEPDVTPVAGPDDDTSEALEQMGVLRQMYQGLVASGQIAAERQAFLTSILAELEEILGSPAPGLADKQIRATRVQQLLSQMSEAVLNPSRAQPLEEPVAGSSRLALRNCTLTYIAMS